MELYKNYPLKDLNTFSIEANAKLFTSSKSIDELIQLLKNNAFKNEKLLVLGGGSNILFTEDFDGLVIYPQILGKEIIQEDENHVIVKVNASEEWDVFVEWTVNNGYGGLENLSLIPGSVGACPVQNIGAYGVEVAEVIDKVEAIEISNGELRIFENKECNFDYRNSVFKSTYKNQFIITSVYFKLSKKPIFKTHYGAIKEELEKLGTINLNTVRQAVINIRESKLPDPKKCPNAGSFFKNPIVSNKIATKLKTSYPDIVAYVAEDNQYKIAAGWMIDQLGWKGKSIGGAAVHDKQALVLVNKANSSGKEILNLANQIKESVYETFKVMLDYEVNII